MISRAHAIHAAHWISSTSNGHNPYLKLVNQTARRIQVQFKLARSIVHSQVQSAAQLLGLVCLFCVTAFAQKNEKVSRKYDMSDGLFGESVQQVLQDRQGFLWIKAGTALNRFDGYTFTNYSNNPSFSSILESRAQILFQDRLGHFWTRERGRISVLNPETERYVHRFPPNLFTGNVVRIRER